MTELPKASELIARPKYINGVWADTGTHWNEDSLNILRVLCDAGADIEKSAGAIGRSPKSIVHRARDSGLILPDTWMRLIKPKPRPRQSTIVLAYPYISKIKDEYADIIAIHQLVPRWVQGREDVCQEILIALYEKRLTLASLKFGGKTLRGFISEFYKKNYEARGHAISLDSPMRIGGDRLWYESIPDPSSLEDKTFDSFEELGDYNGDEQIEDRDMDRNA